MEDLRSGARMVPWILKRGSRSLEDKDKDKGKDKDKFQAMTTS